MNKNVVIVGLTVAVLVIGGLLLNNSFRPYIPPEEPPPTPTPTPQSDKPCEYRTIEFKIGESKETKKQVVFAHPEELDNVRKCAMVLFSNQTGKKITIEFLPRDDGTKSPFDGVDSFDLEPGDLENQFSKGLPVAVELAAGTVVEEYKYKVVPDGPPETEQSPRIRIGPKAGSTIE